MKLYRLDIQQSMNSNERAEKVETMGTWTSMEKWVEKKGAK